MKICVGSTNPVKVQAVKEVIKEYSFLAGATVFSKDVKSFVSDQPTSLEETITGAINRAVKAQIRYDIGIGIESGLMAVAATITGFMDVCVCAIYKGKHWHLGLSSAFECPPKVINLVLSKGIDLNRAFYKLELTKKRKLGSYEGAIGLLTKGRVDRLEYTKQALRMALLQLENKKLYKK